MNEDFSCLTQCSYFPGSCEYCGSGKCCKDGVKEYDCRGWEGGIGSHICVPSWSCNYTYSIDGTIEGFYMPYYSDFNV